MTGGAGYIGSALVPYLLKAGHDVRVLDDFSLSSPRNFIGGDLSDIEFYRGDIRNETAVRAAMDGVDAVIHLAAVTGAETSHEMRERVADVNIHGTEVVADLAEQCGVDRFVLASSCNIYGGANDMAIHETDEPVPRNPYAESKVECESIVASREFDSVSLRLATNFGYSPGIRFNLVVNTFVFRALAGERLTVYGDGTNWRPFLHVQDSARAFAAALDWPAGTYNVGFDNFQIETIAEAVAAVVDHPVEIELLEAKDAGLSYHVEFQRMAAQDFEPRVSLRDGISDLAERFDG